MSSLEKYYQGETFRQKVQVTDVDSVDINPNTIVITIEDSTGTKKITATAMTKDDVGLYHYDYDIPSDGALGEWTTEVNGEKTQIAIEHDRFLVMEAL
jgi:uncharacterized protein YfaS (alpha-2-macroglobulin family)